MNMLSEMGANGGVQTEVAACVLLRTFVQSQRTCSLLLLREVGT